MLTQVIVAVVMMAACWLLVTVFQSESRPALQRTKAAVARRPSPRQTNQSKAAAEAWENEGGAMRGRS